MAIGVGCFLTKERLQEHNIGPGDDVFMVGRFVNYDGRQRNLPTVRFGSISMMPWEPVTHPTRGIVQESYLVEMRSLSGYSGSPVFVYLSDAKPPEGDTSRIAITPQTSWLLGIDWAHLPVIERVKQSDAKTDVSQGHVVLSNSGQMAVVPAWKLLELLYTDDLIESRREADKKFSETLSASAAILDTHTSDDDGFDSSDFHDALCRVSRKISQSESKKN